MDLEKLTRQLESLSNYTQRGTEYLEQKNYYSAIVEFSKVADNFNEVLDLVAKNESYPYSVIGLYLNIVSQALLGRKIAYLSIGEKEKARADEEKVDTINILIDGIKASEHMKSTLERIKAEEKKEEGSSLGRCLIVIVIIILFFLSR